MNLTVSLTFFFLLLTTTATYSGSSSPSRNPHHLPTILRVSVPKVPSRVRLEPVYSNPSNNSTISGYNLVGGLYKYVLDALSQSHNVSVAPTPTEGGGTGLPIPNTTRWNGVIGDILEDRADLGIVTALTYSRNRVIDFSHLVELEEMIFVVGKPQRVYTWKTIFLPFRRSLWVLTAIFGLFVAMVLSQVPKKEGWWSGGPNPRNGLQRGITMVVGGLWEEPQDFLPGHREPLVYILWIILCLNIGALYKSRYFSLLTFPITESVPRDFEQLANSDYNCSLQYFGGAGIYLFKTSKSPALKKIMANTLHKVPGTLACFEQVLQRKKNACITWGGNIEFVVGTQLGKSNGDHPFLLAKTPAFFGPLAFSMKKKSKMAPVMSTFALRIVQSGLMSHWKRMDIVNVRNEINGGRGRGNSQEGGAAAGVGESNDAGGNVAALSVKQTIGCFLLWLMGIFAAVVGGLAEKVVHGTNQI